MFISPAVGLVPFARAAACGEEIISALIGYFPGGRELNSGAACEGFSDFALLRKNDLKMIFS
ncbi:hypothetical protein [Izhakiella australiensis]|uniref:hypothetical protein n=1 Tax=Izhakiella australiensis TaxID=1926881 RepID=UPI0011156720|nr:hypothetical protein [Izhakiella australiensis]